MNSLKIKKIKLTAIYSCILLIVITILSIIVWNLQDANVYKFENFRKHYLAPRRRLLTEQEEQKINQIIDESRKANIFNLIILDGILLVFGVSFSYILASREINNLEKYIKKQRDLITQISHELKTPLTTIRTEAEILNRTPRISKQDYKNFVDNLIKDIDKLASLINTLLEDARLLSGTVKPKFQNINVESIIKQTVEKFTPLAQPKNITLKVKIEGIKDEAFILHTDETLLTRLISIILDNAIKYNKENGLVLITYGLGTNRRPFISIKDTGTGIPPSQIKKIFRKFYRINEYNSNGFGLGLSIAKKISRIIQCHIQVESSKEGSCFTLVFPKKFLIKNN